MPNLTYQPIEYNTGITLTRSAVIYRYSGCSQNNTYTFNLYYDYNTINTNTLYVSIDRRPDVYGYITIDASDLLQNIIDKEEIDSGEYLNIKSTYFKSTLDEYNSGLTIVSTTTSNISFGTLGYITSGNDVFDDFYITNPNYLMHSIQTSNSYLSAYPLFIYYNFFVYKSDTNNYDNVKGKITYGNILGTTTTGQTNASSLIPKYKYIMFFNLNRNMLVNYDNGVIRYDVIQNNVVKNTYYFKLLPESCEEKNFIDFRNRFGVKSRFWFYGRYTREQSTTSDVYKSNKIDYNISNSLAQSYRKKITNSRQKIVFNTGWIDEVRNEEIRDMFLSEDVMFNGQYVILTDTSVKFKTNKYDRLFNYTFTFDEAFDKIKNTK